MTPAQALREAARQLEHDCEFNVGRTLRWSASRQAENNRRIAESRALHDRADALEQNESRDIRYDYVTCASCGKQYQRIDFFGNPHAWLCAHPLEQTQYGAVGRIAESPPNGAA